MDVTLIVNPYASQVTQERVQAVERELARGAVVTTLLTERPGHGVELAAGVGDADAIVVFSGDGGFNEALNGLAADVPIGFLPGGRTSVLPRALGLPQAPVDAADPAASRALHPARPWRGWRLALRPRSRPDRGHMRPPAPPAGGRRRSRRRDESALRGRAKRCAGTHLGFCTMSRNARLALSGA